MEHIHEGGDGIASGLANLCLLDEGVVEKRDCILFLFVRVAACVFSLGLLPRGCPGDVEPHLRQLILSCDGSPALGGAVCAVCRAILVDGELDGDFVSAGKVGVGDLGIRNLEGRAILDVECELRLAKLRLPPIPASERVFLVLEIMAVPVLEDLAEPVVVLDSQSAATVRRQRGRYTSCWKPSSWVMPEFLCKILIS